MIKKEILERRLELIKYHKDLHKKLAIEEIEKEEMIPATSDLLMMRDFKEQELLIERILNNVKNE